MSHGGKDSSYRKRPWRAALWEGHAPLQSKPRRAMTVVAGWRVRPADVDVRTLNERFAQSVAKLN